MPGALLYKKSENILSGDEIMAKLKPKHSHKPISFGPLNVAFYLLRAARVFLRIHVRGSVVMAFSRAILR